MTMKRNMLENPNVISFCRIIGGLSYNPGVEFLTLAFIAFANLIVTFINGNSNGTLGLIKMIYESPTISKGDTHI